MGEAKIFDFTGKPISYTLCSPSIDGFRLILHSANKRETDGRYLPYFQTVEAEFFIANVVPSKAHCCSGHSLYRHTREGGYPDIEALCGLQLRGTWLAE
jgi:hypothetical protein